MRLRASDVSLIDAKTTTPDVHIRLNRREERLQPFIRGNIRKVAGKDLEEVGMVSRRVPRQSSAYAYFEAGGLFDRLLRSRRHAVFSDRGGEGVGHWGNELVDFGGMNAVNRFLVSNLGVEEKEDECQQRRFLIPGKLRSITSPWLPRVVSTPSFNNQRCYNVLLHMFSYIKNTPSAVLSVSGDTSKRGQMSVYWAPLG